MLPFCLALYDVTGIQNFIFSSKKMKENIGASLIVEKVFEDFLRRALREEFGELDEEEFSKNVCWDWKKMTELRIASRSEQKAEIIYAGGGNALVAFRDRGLAVSVTRRFSCRVMEETAGRLEVAVAYEENVHSGDDFSEVMKRLRRSLDRCKFAMPLSIPVLGLAVTRDGVTDGLPAARDVGEGKSQEWLSDAAFLKREAARAENRIDRLISRIFSDEYSRRYVSDLELDRLGRDVENGESFLGIVHIDGNGMGKKLDGYLAKAGDFAEAVQRLRQGSKQVSETYEKVFIDVVNELAHIWEMLKDEKFRQSHPDKCGEIEKFVGLFKLDAGHLPLRPLIFAGDDVTFACDGRIAFDLTTRFLRKLYDSEKLDDKKFSACAGIAVVKPHFPFWRAYDLAEKLCASAKCRARERSSDGCWMDFQIVYTGLPADLKDYRSVKYTTMHDKHSLLWRPYSVCDECGKQYTWKEALAHKNYLDEHWPHSKIKELREALSSSETASKLLLKECCSRGMELNAEPDTGFKNGYTRWYDLLELEDVYNEIPWLDKEDDGKEVHS